MEWTETESAAFCAKNYAVACHLKLSGNRPTRLRDHHRAESRKCRFCGLGKPHVTFRKKAHAIPEFLGNSTVLSMNECDGCNELLACKYEDHLSKWSLFARALSQINRKMGSPTYKNRAETIRVESGMDDNLSIHLSDVSLKSKFETTAEPFEFPLPKDTESQPYIPIRAAMALVKIACSICPVGDLNRITHTFDWLMERSLYDFSMFPVLFTFTPGPITNAFQEVLLLKRTTNDAIPYFLCIVAFANYRLQWFVPFCSSDDSWFQKGDAVEISLVHFPSRFGPDWHFGKTKYYAMDWSGSQPIRSSKSASLHVEKAIRSST